MAENTNTSGNTAKTEKVIVNAGADGSAFDLDEFSQMTGQEIPDFEREEEEEDVVVDPEELKKEKVEEKDSEDEESDEKEEEVEEEESEKDEEKPDLEKIAVEKSSIKAKTKDGKEVFLPEDLKIYQKVDGEVKEISLKEHLNIVAGELTVNQRLSKVASFRQELIEKEATITQRETAETERAKELLNLIERGNPEKALLYLSEKTGHSPYALYKGFLLNISKAAEKFDKFTPEQIDNWFLTKELEWKKNKEKEKAEAETKKSEINNWLANSQKVLNNEQISSEEFTKASKILRREGHLEGLSREDAFEFIVEQIGYVKNETHVKKAIESLNPKLLENEKLIGMLLDQTDYKTDTVEDIQEIVKQVLGDRAKSVASSMSKKSPIKKGAISEKKGEAKQEKKRVLASSSDMSSLFGF